MDSLNLYVCTIPCINSFPKISQPQTVAYPPTPLALVMLIVSEAKMGQEGEEEVHNKHIQNRR